jgi:tetratricopeptide (TPR) repeat protein
MRMMDDNARMAAVVFSALLAMAVPAAGQQDLRTAETALGQYREIVEAYRSGRIIEAIRAVEALPARELQGDLGAAASAFRHPAQAPGVDERFLRAAALLHTDTAAHLWPTSRPQALQHLDIARGWADAVGPPFRPRWYVAGGLLLVNLGIEQGGGVNAALTFFDHACVTLPGEVPLLIASAWLNERTAFAPGTWDEMPNDWAIGGVLRGRRTYLEDAARRLAAALAANPSTIEAALRLGRVRTLLGDAAKAESVLSEVARQPGIPPAQAYLARLLLGRARERAGDAAAAESHYRAAARLMPSAQSARMALANQRYASGDAPEAADVIEPALAATDHDVRDPWNDYLIDHLARGEAVLVALRAEVQQ